MAALVPLVLPELQLPLHWPQALVLPERLRAWVRLVLVQLAWVPVQLAHFPLLRHLAHFPVPGRLVSLQQSLPQLELVLVQLAALEELVLLCPLLYRPRRLRLR